MKKIQYILGGIALLTFPAGVYAQKQAKDSTVNRTVIVEQEYNPAILDASKVNILPKVEKPTVGKKVVEYDVTMIPANDIPVNTMQAYTGKETQAKTLPGYARLGYGTYGNLDFYANYLFSLSKIDRLNLTLQMNGMNGQLDLPENAEKWKSFYYHTYAGMDYVHNFKKVDLNIAGKFDLSNFNLLPEIPGNKQNFSSGNLHFGLKSTNDELPLQFRAETNLLLYKRQHDFGVDDTKENIIRTKAEVTGSISESQFVGVALAMDNVFYTNNLFTDYTSLGLNPHYRLENDDWKIRLGANVDIAFGFGKKFYVAPDFSAQYNFSDSYILYAQAKGGKQQNDFRRLEEFCPYGQLFSQQDATYEQLNAALGFKASPTNGLWFNLYGGYQQLKNDLFFEPAASASAMQMLRINQWNTNNIYAGVEVSYDYKGIISFSASGIYRNWDAKDDDLKTREKALAFKPAFETNLRMGIRPISSVIINLGYQNIAREKTEGQKADPISNLYLNGNYEFFKNISIYARVNNLLNKEYQYYWGYPTEGISFMGGVSFKF